MVSNLDNFNYVCSNCGTPCYYDGRCGDGPVLYCDCVKNGHWINDGRGGYHYPLNNAQPIHISKYNKDKKWVHLLKLLIINIPQ